MDRFQTISVALFVVVLTVAPVIAWALMMYRELEATGVLIAAIS